MTHIAGFERDQLLLLPEAVDDYVEVNNPVRSIDALVVCVRTGEGHARAKAQGVKLGRRGDQAA